MNGVAEEDVRAGRRSLIVVASLLDRVPNLAGTSDSWSMAACLVLLSIACNASRMKPSCACGSGLM